MIDFRQNRARCIDALAGGLAVLTAYDEVQGSGDEPAPFQQESNFWWLSGIERPGWKLIIDGLRSRTTLVRPHLDAVQQTFVGELSSEEAKRISGADAVIDAHDFEAELRQLAKRHTVVYEVNDRTDYGFMLNPASRDLSKVLQRIFPSVQSCLRQLRELRAIKQPEEIAALRQAIALTIEAFDVAKERLPHCQHEYECEAEFDYLFRRRNARHAYSPIVAGGANACTLHYSHNVGPLAAENMVLIDVGARVNGYCADITRTYGIEPTQRQQDVHAAVVQAQQHIIELLEPNLPVADYIQQSDDIMRDALQQLGLLRDRHDQATFRRYYPHATSHGLGVDTHDSLGAPRVLRAGMVLTVEPGIYIPEEGIGVRIEDDILITPSGHDNLSASLSTKW